MEQAEKAARFAELHVKGKPLLLFNAWDAGSAKAIFDAGAPAIATSSWSIAEAQGYRDGEDIPLELAEQVIARIAATVDARSARTSKAVTAKTTGNSPTTSRVWWITA